MASLPVIYRPQTFEEVLGQDIVVKILQQQLETNTFKNTYLFCGPSGDGKTTIARIFANEINNDEGEPIEVDAASNNGVDNIRSLIDEAKTRALNCKYKVIIVDEAHMITTAGWNAFLKTLEEPPKYTIFIFCTTDPQKIPATILNRVTRFNLNRIKPELIKDRLEYVCFMEGYKNYKESCDYISRISNGGMRDALAYLEKCASYSVDLSIENVLKTLGNFSFEVFLSLTNGLIDKDEQSVLNIISDVFNQGGDLKQFVEQYLDFVLDLNKYCIFHDLSLTKIPASLEDNKTNLCVAYVTDFNGSDKFFKLLLDKLFDLKNSLKYDSMPKTTVEINLLNICKGL